MKMFRLVGTAVLYVAIYTLLLYVIITLCQKGYRFCYEIFGPTAVQEDAGVEKAFQVGREDTMQSVSQRLEEEGLIVNKDSFYMRIKLMETNRQELRPGVYLLRPDMDYEEIINRLTDCTP